MDTRGLDTGGVARDVLDAGGLALEVNGLVATITLNRPATKNAQTPETWQALRIIGSALDPAVRVVVRAAGAAVWRTASFLALARAFWRRCRCRFFAFFDAVIGRPSGRVPRSGSR